MHICGETGILRASRMPATLLAALFLAFTIFLVLVSPARAEAQFNPSYIISDNDFSAYGTMSEAQIQGFLEAKGSYLANYREDRGGQHIGPGDNIDPSGWRASHIIWQVANWYHINPQVILATLQKEQSLITNPARDQYGLDWAMGYAVPDSGGRDYSKIGFSTQVDWGTWQLSQNQYWANRRDAGCSRVCVAPYTTGNTINIDGSNVYLGNGATASLYRYTPHFHGNQNFYNIYTRWFTFLPPSPDNTGSSLMDVDPDGDNLGELAILYDYVWGRAGLWLFEPSGKSYAPRRVWFSNTWEAARSKMVPVDVNGDGATELAVLYDTGWSNSAIYIFDTNASGGYNAPRRVWESGPGNWDWSRSRLTAVDQNGDGKTELAVFYNYGNATTRIWLFDPNGAGGYNRPRLAWDSGPGRWEWSRSKIGGAGRNLFVFYEYGNATTRLWLFDPNTAGGYNRPRVAWYSGPGNWEWSRSKVSVADQNRDGQAELAVLYNYGNATAGLWLFDPNGSGGYNRPRQAWNSGPGNWDWTRSKFTAVDQNGDSRTELAVFYNYSNSTTGLWLFDPNANGGYNRPRVAWYSGARNWDWTLSRPVL